MGANLEGWLNTGSAWVALVWIRGSGTLAVADENTFPVRVSSTESTLKPALSALRKRRSEEWLLSKLERWEDERTRHGWKRLPRVAG